MSSNQHPRRRRWAVGGLVVALLAAGAASAYAGVRVAEDSGSAAHEWVAPSAGPPVDQPSIPPLFPSGPPRQHFNCARVLTGILGDMVLDDRGYVESRRAAADRLRELDVPTPFHRALLDELADELDAAAQLVEDDPSAYLEANDREEAASNAFIEAGGCLP